MTASSNCFTTKNGVASGGGVSPTRFEPAPTVLLDLVERYQVCWDVWPEYISVEREKRQIGFTLELSGTHGPGNGHPTPGCLRCREVFAALQVIALYIQPKEERPSVYEIESYDQALHYSPKRGNRPEVSLALRILHREGFERPADDCEVRCLSEMKARLKELGAGEGRWVPRKESP